MSGRGCSVSKYGVVELCAGAGGQALGLERAGFDHAIAVEIDPYASATLKANRDWRIATGDVADPSVWEPVAFRGTTLLAGGVPCPPFSLAGRQLGANDERDLFAWSIELIPDLQPRAVMLENVRGLSMPRFAGYRQRVIDRLAEFGYRGEWRLLNASDFGVPQLRPRFVLIALQHDDVPYFHWPQAEPTTETVGTALRNLMASNGWVHADAWAEGASGIAPTIVGGSKKHGGADLGPTRSKQAWGHLGVDGHGIADRAPAAGDPHPAERRPRLTLEMVQRLQGWDAGSWRFIGPKTAVYRQVGNAFPAPVASALGRALIRTFEKVGQPAATLAADASHSWIYRALRDRADYVPLQRLAELSPHRTPLPSIHTAVEELSRDFIVEVRMTSHGPAYRLGDFRGFVGQSDHLRQNYLRENRSAVS